ncbi:hypothetical protein GJ496_008227 [Pomphorhynchus laevis]|nr:hypothetical protein GJ496_008227 [Pomphorhynchus laevis]
MGKICRITVCGCINVGKTFVLQQLTQRTSSNYEYSHTIEDVFVYNLDRDVNCRLYDTGGVDPTNLEYSIKLFIQEHETILSISEAIIFIYDPDDGGNSFGSLHSLMKSIEQNCIRKEPYIYMLLGLRRSDEQETSPTSELANHWKQQEKQIVLWREIQITDDKSLQDTFTCFIGEVALGQAMSTLSDSVISTNADIISFRSLRDKAGRLLQSVIRKTADSTDSSDSHKVPPSSKEH